MTRPPTEPSADLRDRATDRHAIIGDGTDTPADEVTPRRRARRGRKDG